MSEQYHFWNNAFSGEAYYYGDEPGPVARRAVRYAPRAAALKTHFSSNERATRLRALDAGCGEGQDLVFLAERGYEATGWDFTEAGIAKTRALLETRGLAADTAVVDLTKCDWPEWQGTFDIVIAVNSLQFLGEAAPVALRGLAGCVAPGGILGLSLFAPTNFKQRGPADLRSELFLCSQAELWDLLNPESKPQRFLPLETAELQQWSQPEGRAQSFITVVARRTFE